MCVNIIWGCRVAVTTSVNREADKISMGRYEISTKSMALPSQPSSNLISLWHKEFSLELLPQCFPKHFGRWLSSYITSDACAVLSQASPTHDPPSWLSAICYLSAPLLRLCSCHWQGRRGTVGKSSKSKVDYGGTTSLMHCLSLTMFIKSPAGK